MLLGSPFGDHACSGKSKSHPADIRQKLIALEGQKVRPLSPVRSHPGEEYARSSVGRCCLMNTFDPNTHIQSIVIVGCGGINAYSIMQKEFNKLSFNYNNRIHAAIITIIRITVSSKNHSTGRIIS